MEDIFSQVNATVPGFVQAWAEKGADGPREHFLSLAAQYEFQPEEWCQLMFGFFDVIRARERSTGESS